jgi:hypothetical protein
VQERAVITQTTRAAADSFSSPATTSPAAGARSEISQVGYRTIMRLRRDTALNQGYVSVLTPQPQPQLQPPQQQQQQQQQQQDEAQERLNSQLKSIAGAAEGILQAGLHILQTGDAMLLDQKCCEAVSFP